MAKLSFEEKQLIEHVFDMQCGYVLEFNNREFQDFMEEVLGIKVYSDPRYARLSKAKILRALLEDQPAMYVGKIIVSLINYMRKHGYVTEANRKDVQELQRIGEEKLGRRQKKEQRPSPAVSPKTDIDYKEIERRLLAIESSEDAQAKGYAFEEFLNWLFGVFGLNPRAPYKTEYNQTDGSFTLDGTTVLLEAKYRITAPSQKDLVYFNNKIETNSTSARGLFVSLLPVEAKTEEYFRQHGKSFVCMTVEELSIMCSREMSLTELLKQKFRWLDETGSIYRNILKC